MSNVTFLWIFSRGIELGVIVLCLLPLRALLRKKVPRLYSYVLWSALPINILYSLCMWFIPKRNYWIIDHINKSPKIVVDENIIRVMKYSWVCGTVMMILVMLYSYIRFRNYLIGSICIRKGIYLAERIRSPFTLGIFCPKIYLPTSLCDEYYEAVILHEKVHIARRDVLMKYLAIVFLGVFWFQPMLWYGFRRFINDMEEACDEAVLRKKGKEYCAEYARTLVEVSYQAGKVRGVAIGYGNGEIKERIKNVMNYECPGTSIRIAAFVICVVFMVVAIPLSWQIPRMVRAEEHEMITKSMSVTGNDMMKKELLTEDEIH